LSGKCTGCFDADAGRAACYDGAFSREINAFDDL
jgi:hypothetical protein